MAEAIITRLIETKICHQDEIYATNRNNKEKMAELERRYGIHTTYNLEELLQDANMIVFAVKPKDADAVLQKVRPFINDNTVFVSVLAGISLHFLEERLNTGSSIVRAMPNTSASVGKSATAITFNSNVTVKQMQLTQDILAAVGMTTVVEENQLDAITGLAGSGPAYIYYLVEAMEQSAKELGLEADLAKKLIIQTLSGATEMLLSSKKEAADLRFEVTSPGGTTEAGIQVLQQKAVKEAVIECIKTAANQAKELGKLHESRHINSL